MGITRERNFNSTGIEMSLHQFEPHGPFLRSDLGISANANENFTTKQVTSVNLNLNLGTTTRNYFNFHIGGEANPIDEIDYYEARTPGRIFIRTPHYFGSLFFGTDTRKKLFGSINVFGGSTTLISKTIGYNPFYGTNLQANMRVTDKLSFSISGNLFVDDGDRGWVNSDYNGQIIFGLRKLTNVENVISARYLFRNNLSLSIRARHYWSKGYYRSFYTLMDDGHLADNISYDQNHDFNFNAFNIDMVFQWQFAPGSSMNLVWKNSIYNEGDRAISGYGNDLQNTFDAKQLNTVSLKILYYFDYLYLKKKRK